MFTAADHTGELSVALKSRKGVLPCPYGGVYSSPKQTRWVVCDDFVSYSLLSVHFPGWSLPLCARKLLWGWRRRRCCRCPAGSPLSPWGPCPALVGSRGLTWAFSLLPPSRYPCAARAAPGQCQTSPSHHPELHLEAMRCPVLLLPGSDVRELLAWPDWATASSSSFPCQSCECGAC